MFRSHANAFALQRSRLVIAHEASDAMLADAVLADTTSNERSKLYFEEESRLFLISSNSGWDVNRDEPGLKR